MIWKPWWERYPDKYKDELEALDQAGIKYAKDQKAFNEGIFCLHLETETTGKLRVIFPDLYPYFRFEIYADELQLPHHQNPFRKNLCLIGRSTDNWRPSYTLASFLIGQLPKVVLAGLSHNKEEVDHLEEHHAEPISDFFTYETGAGIIVDPEVEIKPFYKSGFLLIGVISTEAIVIQGGVLNIMDENKIVLAKSDNRLRQVFREGPFSARWLRLKDPPHINDPRVLFNDLLSKSPYLNYIDNNQVKGGILQIRAAIFPEETRAWRRINQGWIFVCKFEPRNYGK